MHVHSILQESDGRSGQKDPRWYGVHRLFSFLCVLVEERGANQMLNACGIDR